MYDHSWEHVWHAPLTPLTFLERSARVFPNHTAVVYGQHRWDYATFFQRVRRLAHALQLAGIESGDRVAFLCPNTPPLLEAHFGVPLAGAVLVAINTRLNTDEISYILDHSGARILFVDAELAPMVAPLKGQMPWVTTMVMINDDQDEARGMQLSDIDYEHFIAGAEPLLPERVPMIAEHDTISINYTSGTTGRPKGVMYSHRGAYLAALGEVLTMGINSTSVYLWVLPMFHCNGWCFPWAVTAAGATHVCLRSFEPGAVIHLVGREHVSHFCAAPTVMLLLLNHPEIEQLRSSGLHVLVSAAPPSPTMLHALDELGVRITHSYGLTETYGPHSVCEWHAEWDQLPGEQRARLKARQGVPYLHAVEMRVVDDDMHDVPADGQTLGEVIMRGNNVMRGYYRQSEATAQAFAGGWFHSGDLAVVHPDGYIELCDRKKDIIISGGENISTIEIERVLAQHPHVLEAAVIAVPHDLWGEVPKAFVSLKLDSYLSEQDLIDFCRTRLPGYKVPQTIVFMDLPKTSTGKIIKYQLREMEWAGQEKRIH